MKSQTKAIGFALLSVLCWSTVAPAFKLALNEISVVQVLTIAAGVAALVLGIILLIQGKFALLRQISKRDFLWSILFAAINPVIYYLVLFSAYDRLPAQIAQPLNYTWPVMLSLLAIPFLKQKLSIKAFLALLISFGGVLVISLQNLDGTGLESDTTGIILAILSSVAWAIYWLLQVKSKLDKSVQLFLNFSISFVMLILIFILSGQTIPTGIEAWLPSIWIGVFEMGITFFFWMSALQFAYRTDLVSNLAFLSPFVSLFFINLVLHEPISEATIIGLALIVGGILLQRRISKQLA
ncbi:MAG: DMT family transporter [Bacteroidales bacterium]|jgi:drug/metabolite transporter (DMT)-like permease|nr:DMT family transporter [Bacteroidales bacterium]